MEDIPERIVSNARNRKNIQHNFDMCIEPLNSDNNPEITAQMVLSILLLEELSQMLSMLLIMWLLERNRWNRLRQAGRKVSIKLTMSVSYTYIKLRSADCSYTNLVYVRVMDVYLKYVFSHQLAPVPTLVFKDNGNMRITKSKSRMKWKLQVEQSSRTMPTHVVDGCAIMWIIQGSKHYTLQDLVNPVL